MFTIQSSMSDRRLVFHNRRGDYYFDVALTGNAVNAGTSVYDDGPGLDHLFQELAYFDKPWSGKKKWESLEGDLAIAVACDSLGHVMIEVKMQIEVGSAEAASISAGLTVDFGALPSIASDAQAFFAPA